MRNPNPGGDVQTVAKNPGAVFATALEPKAGSLRVPRRDKTANVHRHVDGHPGVESRHGMGRSRGPRTAHVSAVFGDFWQSHSSVSGPSCNQEKQPKNRRLNHSRGLR